MSDCPSHHDLDFGDCCLASLVFVAAHNLPNHGLYVDHGLPCPPSWLQLLAIILVVVILIFFVIILHLLCL